MTRSATMQALTTDTSPAPIDAAGNTRQDRVRDFIEATWRCLKAHGVQGTSVRRIAQEAGVTPGLLIHYFPGKDALIAESYAMLADQVLTEQLKAAASAREQGRCPLSAFLSAGLNDEGMGSDLLRLWVHYWGLILSDSQMRSVHDRTHGAFKQALAGLIAEAYPDHPEPEKAADGASALLDGLWLSWGLAPEQFESRQAQDHLHAFIQATAENR